MVSPHHRYVRHCHGSGFRCWPLSLHDLQGIRVYLRNHPLELRHKNTGPERILWERREILIGNQSLKLSNHLCPDIYLDLGGIDVTDFFFFEMNLIAAENIDGLRRSLPLCMTQNMLSWFFSQKFRERQLTWTFLHQMDSLI